MNEDAGIVLKALSMTRKICKIIAILEHKTDKWVWNSSFPTGLARRVAEAVAVELKNTPDITLQDLWDKVHPQVYDEDGELSRW